MSAPHAGAAGAAEAALGVYTLANDTVIDRALALFESVKTFAPTLPLRVIPYDPRQQLLADCVRRFGYAYFESPEQDALQAIGERFYPASEFAARGFRKLAAFEGPFERFLFLDSDVVALSPITTILGALESADVDLVHFDTDLDQVYRRGPLRERLVANGARGFNCGLFAGRRGALTVARLASSLARFDADWSTQLVPNAEQPFLNYFADHERLRVAAAYELLPGHCSTCWPAAGRIEADGADYRLRDSGRWDEGWKLLCAHWAGFPLDPAMPNHWLFEHFHRLGARRLAGTGRSGP